MTDEGRRPPAPPVPWNEDVLAASRILAFHQKYERGCNDCPELDAGGGCPTLTWALEIRRVWAATGQELPPVDTRIGLD